MKKKLFKPLLFAFAVACLISLFFVSASAVDKVVGDFVFSVNGSSATLKEYNGTDADVVIPSKVGSARVTTIYDAAFWGNKTMKSVSIPSTVTVIGSAAFNECSSLTRVVLPSKLTTLGDAVFWYCTGLRQVFIPKTVTSMGKHIFAGCSKLTVYVVKGSYAETRVPTYPQADMAYRYITSLGLSKTSLTLSNGSSSSLNYTYSPSKVYYSKVTYSSSDTTVATVDSSGKVTAKGIGTATITCTTKDGGKVTVKCTVKVVPPRITSFTVSDKSLNGYTISWDMSEGATKYNVYLYNSSTKAFKLYKTTTATSLKVSGLAAGSTQKYKIRAVTVLGGKNHNSYYSAVYKASVAKPDKVTDITVKPAADYVNLSWKATTFATSYRVYTYDSNTSKYTYKGETSKTSFKVTKLSPDTKYTFMVRAKAKTSNGYAYASYSPLTDCTTRPAYVTGFGLVEGSLYTSKLTLRWDKIPGVTGYQIALYDSKTKNYKRIRTLVGEDSTECTVTELLPSTEHQFVIRAYVTRDSSTTYGYYTADALIITTNNRPTNAREAYTAFDNAYLGTKLSDGSFTLMSISGYEDTVGDEEDIQTILSASGIGKTLFSYITDGKDSLTGTPVGSLISSSEDFSGAGTEGITPLTFEEDGNGFRLTFTADEEATPYFVRFPDFSGTDSITVDSVSLSQATVTAKMQEAKVDDITVSIPIEVTYTVGSKQKGFTAVITTTYLFIR